MCFASVVGLSQEIEGIFFLIVVRFSLIVCGAVICLNIIVHSFEFMTVLLLVDFLSVGGLTIIL